MVHDQAPYYLLLLRTSTKAPPFVQYELLHLSIVPMQHL